MPSDREAEGSTPTLISAELAPQTTKVGIRLNSENLQVQVKPGSVRVFFCVDITKNPANSGHRCLDQVCASAGVKDGMYLVALKRSDGRYINVRGHSPMQVCVHVYNSSSVVMWKLIMHHAV